MIDTISDIPVLFFPFSRPQYARQVFDAIKKAQPRKFYFYCDKAREGNEEEIKNNNIIREYINEVDWDCDLKTWFRDENIGVYTSILNAIDWFFDNEEYGIILEEDCLPSMAFFDFCRQLLPKYKDDPRVWFISGNNFVEDFDFKGYDYLFSAISYQWGWATWKSRWEKNNRNGFDIKKMIEEKLFYNVFGSKKIARFENIKWLQSANEKGVLIPVSWDYIFQMTMRTYNGLAIVPRINLTSNIGVIGFNSKKSNKHFHNKKLPEESVFIIQKNPNFVVSNMDYVHAFYNKLLLRHYWSKMIRYYLSKLGVKRIF